MTSFTVLVVPDHLRHTVTALRDLTAMGLVTPFCWTGVSTAGINPQRGDVIWVQEGVARTSRLDRQLAVLDPDQVRMVALSHWSRPEEAGLTLAAAEQLLVHLPPSTRRTHLVLAPPDGATTAPVGRGGWINVVISPEDGYRPDSAHAAWSADANHSEEGRRAASAIAALSGILEGHDSTWIDDLRASATPTFHVARVYYRRLDGRKVEHAIHRNLFDMSTSLPRVWADRQQADYFTAPAEAAEAMAQRWWTTARSDLVGSRATVPPPQTVSIGVFAALRHFFTFLLSAIKNAPGAWARNLVRRAEEQLTSTVGGHVFGDRSAYQVVLRADGHLADHERVSTALRALDDSLPRFGEASAQHPQAWKALIEGALVLADAGGGSGPMAFLGDGAATVPSPHSIVAPDKNRYQVQAASLRPHLTTVTVEASDYLGTRRLAGELGRLGKDSSVGSDAAVEKDSLQRWWQEQGTTYGGQTARLLGDAHLAAMKEIEQIARRLETDEERLAREAEELAAAQKRVRTRVMLWLVLGFIAAAALLTLGLLSIIVMGLAGGLAALVLVIGVIAAFGAFYGQQRRLFQLLHRLDESAQLAPVLNQNLAAAVRDARTTLDAYDVHQLWLGVLRHFLEDPFGARSRPDVEPLDAVGTMPLSTAIGAGHADQVLMAKEVRRLQRRHFPRGWMHKAWGHYMDALPAHLGVSGVHLSSGGDILRQRGADTLTTLRQVIHTVDELGSPPSVGAEVWASVLDELQEAAEQGRDLLPEVTLLGSSTVLSREEFVRKFADGGDPQPFRQTLFDADALTSGLNVPRGVWDKETEQGLSRSRVLVAHSEEMPPERLVPYRFDDRDKDDDKRLDLGPVF